MSADLKLEGDSYLPLRDVVFNTLRNAIIRGDLKPGERLMEVHIAGKLGVSRTPIREAIRMLEREGLAITIPRCGAQVAKMNEKDLQDVLEIRDALDVLAVTVACERKTDEEMAQLKSALAEFERVTKKDDVRAIVEADVAFHNVIYNMTHNPRLEGIVSNIREQMYRYRYEYIRTTDSLQTLVNEHRAIVEGFEKNDIEYVTKIMHKHLQNQIDSVSNYIKNQEESDKEA